MNPADLTDEELLTMAQAYEDAALGSGAWNRFTTEEKFAALDGIRAALAHLPARFKAAGQQRIPPMKFITDAMPKPSKKRRRK